MEIQSRRLLRRLAMVGLLAVMPATAFAQAATAPDAKPAPVADDASRVHPPWPGTHTVQAAAPVATPTAKSISEKGVKKTEAAPDAALAVTPPVEAGKGHNEKGIK